MDFYLLKAVGTFPLKTSYLLIVLELCILIVKTPASQLHMGEQ